VILAKQANKAWFALMKKLFALALSKLSLTSHLFDVLVKPILEYGAELWDHTASSPDNPIEIIHHKFCKYIPLEWPPVEPT